MIIDPQIAVVRTAPSTDFYDRVVDRIAKRAEQPEGILMQFAAIHGDELVVGTAYRDAAAMRDAFLRFTSIEAQNEMIESGVSFDLTRDEYELERLFVEPGVRAQNFASQVTDGVVAITSELIALTPAEYRGVTSSLGWFDRSAPGRLAHVAYDHQGVMRSIDFWESREAAEAWLDDSMTEQFDKLHPGRRTEETSDASWLDVHAFVVSVEPDDAFRNFTRATSGPAHADEAAN